MSAIAQWGAVTQKAERVLIVASGPSVRALTMWPDDGVHVIAVKDAIYWAKNVKTWVSADLNPKKCRPIIEKLKPGIEYIAVVPEEFGTDEAKVVYHRVEPVAGLTYIRRRVIRYLPAAEQRLSEDPSIVCTGNSTFAAFNVAVLMGAKKIAFVGLDASPEKYAYSLGRPRGSMRHVPDLFANVRRQVSDLGVEVVNGSRFSHVRCFPRMTPNEAVRWL